MGRIKNVVQYVIMLFMPVIKIYSSTKLMVEAQRIAALTEEYFGVPANKINILFVRAFALYPAGVFVEINARKHAARTESRMREYLQKVEADFAEQGYPGVRVRIEFFPTEDVHGIN